MILVTIMILVRRKIIVIPMIIMVVATIMILVKRKIRRNAVVAGIIKERLYSLKGIRQRSAKDMTI
ncbi:hypothetical protein MUO14_22825 [Halobacillus shinanisalinarum]|uniref:Uncharacterized protein n=1 Tax=Halobacillus shinanisalinarum TaxID=2932258 RepID=A0ABY4GYT5_9BACI|nr:hypothetical protein [Halobacillus shinanisalinarum]UOQ93181.1 hypothetical protein MUO14_22825 [Halobacillus shinanisalinarum]